MTGIDCNNCGRNVVPRLWHYERPFFEGAAYMRTQHICPFCGVCMYETGGELNGLGKFCAGAFLAIGGLFLALSLLGLADYGMTKMKEQWRAWTAIPAPVNLQHLTPPPGLAQKKEKDSRGHAAGERASGAQGGRP
jgi:hypothetical protein